tara:strand:+ start:1229 stop:1960 length:732 start_codon:yes stop_codon:yes gene_type:complete
MEEFIENTIDPSIFCIHDVINDNSCLYRSLANTLELRKENDKIIHYNPPENILALDSFQYDGDIQEDVARELQNEAYTWVLSNLDKEYPMLGINIMDMIPNCHEMSVDEYIEYYKFFAGDPVIRKIKNEQGERTEVIPNRWGSILELYALSEIYKIPICVYISLKYDIKNNKIITGKIRNEKPEKGVRFRLSEIVGENYINDRPPLFILWRKTQCGPHYMALYPNNETWLDENHKIKINLIEE